jgi:hypothetical protein
MKKSKQAKVGDIIKILNKCGANWLEIDGIYYVGESSPGYLTLFQEDEKPIFYDDRDFIIGWACNERDYEIISSIEDYYEIY